ncbi:MAG: YlbF family regulator, partial [Verrucomicrobiota bacterium]|nr:YlbF family regulator [Verrucomicrobiota bacterium]
RHDYDMLNQRGGLLQQKHEAGMEVTEEEVAEFEKLRETLLANQTVTDFHEVQEEVQQLQDKIHQVIAKTFEIGRVPSQEDFDFCSDGFGDCGCSN